MASRRDWKMCERCQMYGVGDSLDSDSICFSCRARNELACLVEKLSLKISDLEKKVEDMKTNIKENKESAEVKQRASLEDVSKLKMELKEMGSKQVVKMEKEITKLKQEVKAIPAGLSKTVEENLKPKWSEVVSSQIKKCLVEVKDQVKEVQETISVTKTIAGEEKSKEKRRNNFIIHKLTESTGSTEEDVRKEDKQVVLDLINNTLGVDCRQEDFKRMFRLGQKNNKDRPLLIELRERSIKNSIMESLFKLKNAEEKYRKISVTHDMTSEEREQSRKLVLEAKNKEQQDNSGEWVFRVKGFPGNMRIVKMKKHSKDLKKQDSKKEGKDVEC